MNNGNTKKKIMEDNFIVSQSTLYSAFVQKLGESNYGVDSVVDDIINNWDNFELYVQRLIKREIQIAVNSYKAGLEIDVLQWKRILKLKNKGE